MRVEDHPIEYSDFEGVIPEGKYGAGTVMVWDKGTWHTDVPDVDAALSAGELKFTLHGNKLNGSWVLVRAPRYGRSAWLLIKHRDQYATNSDVTLKRPYSAVSHRLLADIAYDEDGDWEKAASGDPAPAGSSERKPIRSLAMRTSREKTGGKPKKHHPGSTTVPNLPGTGKGKGIAFTA
jgi:ATP-dependent DNA ligase